MSKPIVIRSQRVLTPEGVHPASVHVENGKITAVLPFGSVPPDASELINAGSFLVSPGVVDSHVHINEPGRTEWEGFDTATGSAAAGGITTVVDMPLNSIPATTSRENAEKKLEALAGKPHVNVAFWGGVIPGNTKDLEGLAHFGVPGCKCFTCHSGVDEFPNVTRADLEEALPRLRDLGLTLLVHAEAPGPLAKAEEEIKGLDPRAYSTYLRSRPKSAEDEAIAMVIDLCKKHRAKAHIVHLSSGTALPMIKAAQQDGVQLSAETCLHYLAFTAEEIQAGATHFKCAPPIREASNRDALWKGLEDGTISMVVSDHSPCTPQLKKPEAGDFLGAWGGISSLQLGLSVLWTLAKARGHSLEKLFQWNAINTSKLAGVADRKGKLQAGYDADLVIWDPEASFEVRPEEIRHRHKVTPYAGRKLFGRVKKTFVGGRCAFDETAGLSSTPVGSFLKIGR